MNNYVAPDKIGLFLYLCAPGFILTYMRAQFHAGRMPPPTEGVLTYVTLSVIYQAAILPFTDLKLSSLTNAQLPTYEWALLIFILPALFGAILGINARNQWTGKLLKKLGINTVHPLASAWDWRFGKCRECYVMITLKNETKWAGSEAKNPFSSNPGERDVYLERVYEWKRQRQLGGARKRSLARRIRNSVH